MQKSEGKSLKISWDISGCGLNCTKCDMVTKGECRGCRGPQEKHWTPNCEFMKCMSEKGHRYCFECEEFVCDKLEAFANDGYDHHRITVENMVRMKAIGLDVWIDEQPKEMFCPGWII